MIYDEVSEDIFDMRNVKPPWPSTGFYPWKSHKKFFYKGPFVRTDGRSGPTTRPAFAKATQVKK